MRRSAPQMLTLALVNRAAEQIERALFEAMFRDFEHMHFHSDPYLIGGPHEGLLAFEGDRLVGANRNGVKLLGLDWPARGALQLRRAVHLRARRDQPQSGVGRLRRADEEGRGLLRAHAARGRACIAVWSPAQPAPCRAAQGDLTLTQIIDRLLGGPFARLITIRRVKAGQLIYGADEEKAVQEGLVVVRSGRLQVLRLVRRQGADAVHPRRRRRAADQRGLDVRGQEGRRDRHHQRQGVPGDLAQCDPDLARSAMPAISRMLQQSARMTEDIVFRCVKLPPRSRAVRRGGARRPP